jgi:hypothetical protein
MITTYIIIVVDGSYVRPVLLRSANNPSKRRYPAKSEHSYYPHEVHKNHYAHQRWWGLGPLFLSACSMTGYLFDLGIQLYPDVACINVPVKITPLMITQWPHEVRLNSGVQYEQNIYIYRVLFRCFLLLHTAHIFSIFPYPYLSTSSHNHHKVNMATHRALVLKSTSEPPPSTPSPSPQPPPVP